MHRRSGGTRGGDCHPGHPCALQWGKGLRGGRPVRRTELVGRMGWQGGQAWEATAGAPTSTPVESLKPQSASAEPERGGPERCCGVTAGRGKGTARERRELRRMTKRELMAEGPCRAG